MFKASLYILSFPMQLYCVYHYFFVTSHDDAMFSIADVLLGGGDPTSCAMDEGLATLFRKGSIRIC